MSDNDVNSQPISESEARIRAAIIKDIFSNMSEIVSGTFVMGSIGGFFFSELGRSVDEVQHKVTISQNFMIAQHPVTQAQWMAVMGYNPSEFEGHDHPVENVSWDEANVFCEKLNQIYAEVLPDNYKFTLPTEAQWEYACRAGTETALNTKESLTNSKGVCYNLDVAGWYKKNSFRHTHPVGEKYPGCYYGLYDMHGNVWEWCRDWYGPYRGDAIDPVGPATGTQRVVRGGCWDSEPEDCRSARRFYRYPDIKSSQVGFRLALAPIA